MKKTEKIVEGHKRTKAYCVHTAILNNEKDGGDIHNWNSYNITAIDVQDALEKMNGRMLPNEYVEAVEINCILDD